MQTKPILLFVVNEAYFFVSHRLPIALEAQRQGYDVHVAAPDDNVWAPADYSVDELANFGFTYHRMPMSRRGTSPLQELRTFWAILGLYRRLRPAVVHHLTIKPNLYGGVAARLTGVPSVVYAITGLGQMFVATHGPLRMLRPLVLSIMRFAFGHRNGRVIVQNTSDRKFLVDNRVAAVADTVLIQGSGVDLSLFETTEEPKGEPVVILPSRLIWEKGIQEFVDAAAALRRDGVSARFALIGNTHASNPRAVPEETLRKWEADGIVEWWGRREDMPVVMAESHIVCQPSKYGEGVPKVLLEAAAAGRPVVATDTPGCREVIDDGAEGLLVPAADSAALATALRRLIENPSERRVLGMAARNRAETDFGVASVVAATLEV
ncbi:MAG: glycosyltransferase family 4 protein, partial [Rhodospirillaceae bacterium]|nr:glycosyltransferase family 4 protein [Rhodospirillaceae bacterium]